MASSFIAYIDEAGCEGFKFGGGSSLWFVLSLEPNRFGYTEPRYAEMLRKVAYTHRGSALGYGLKLWPREATNLIESDEKLAWIKKMYK